MGDLILAGGGDACDSMHADDLLRSLCIQNPTLLYIPVALDSSKISYEDARAWIVSVFVPRGFEITMWADLPTTDDLGLDQFGAVYIGGGNTFSLLKQIRESRFGDLLRQLGSGTGVIYGGSAGAIIIGKDIRTCAHMDENTVALSKFEGLDLLKGLSVWCHYDRDEDTRIEIYVRRNGTPVLAIPEKGALHVSNSTLTAVGFDSSWIFTHGERIELKPGTVRNLGRCW